MKSQATLFRKFLRLSATGTSLAAFATAQVLTPTPVASITEPISPAADVTHVLVTAPYHGGGMPFGVYNVTSGTPTLFAPLPSGAAAFGQWENALAISPGFGGFPAGWVFALYPSPLSATQSIIEAIPPTGASTLATAACPKPLPSSFPGPCIFSTISDSADHLGLTFDPVGSVGYQLIATFGNGDLYTVNSTGVISGPHLVTSGGTNGVTPVKLESPRVAPMGFGPYSGYIWAVGEDEVQVYAINPTTFASTPVSFSRPLNGIPESLAFNYSSVCSIAAGATSVQGNLFDAEYGNNAVVSFSDLTPNTGFLNTEYSGLLYSITPPVSGNTYVLTQSASGLGQQEHLNSLTPRTDLPCAGGFCSLTQGGYQNHFNSLVTGLTLGGVFYTRDQVSQILSNNAVKGNGLISLAHQLVTAELNLQYGAIPTGANLQTVLAAVQGANALIATLGSSTVIPPIGNGYLSPQTTSGFESILANYNEGQYGPFCSSH